MLPKGSSGREFQPTRMFLIEALTQLAPKLTDSPIERREQAALVSFLIALRDHYFSVWKQAPPLLAAYIKQNAQYASIKLRRISLQKLGEYL